MNISMDPSLVVFVISFLLLYRFVNKKKSHLFFRFLNTSKSKYAFYSVVYTVESLSLLYLLFIYQCVINRR